MSSWFICSLLILSTGLMTTPTGASKSIYCGRGSITLSSATSTTFQGTIGNLIETDVPVDSGGAGVDITNFYPGPQVLSQASRAVPPFTEIRTDSALEIIVQFGPVESVTVEARADVLPYVDFFIDPVDKSLLQIRLLGLDHKPANSIIVSGGHKFMCSNGIPFYLGPIKVTVTVRSLTGLQLAGASDLTVLSPIVTPNFQMSITGAGKARLSVETNTLSVLLSGAGVVDIAGRAEVAVLSVTGAGTINGELLTADTANVLVSGDGDVSLQCRRYLSAVISGMGRVRYRGDPYVSKAISGMGGISRF